MNFSVGVNMYSANVTSYWYRLRWNQRRREDGYSAIAKTKIIVRPARMVGRFAGRVIVDILAASGWRSASGEVVVMCRS